MIEGSISGDEVVLLRLERLPNAIRKELADEMKKQWLRVQAAVVTKKLSGDPLHRRTGVLASSINVGGPDTATTFEEDSTEIVGRIGTKVWYGRLHEYGGTFHVKAHERKVLGRLGATMTKEHDITFKQRSFLRSTLDEMRDSILDAMRSAVTKATNET